MKVLGIVAEYNPFHTGHLYHIEQAKQLIQPDLTIIVMSPSFVQRGEPAIIDKYTRARIAIENGADIVIELPLVYAVESADYFAKGAITLLKEMGVTDLCFGSEEGCIDTFIEIAKAIEEHQDDYDALIKAAMKQGLRYPDACNQSLSTLLNKEIRTPNDLLGLSYVKEVIHSHYAIKLHCIKRTNDYHSNDIEAISSATALRMALKEGTDVSALLPGYPYYKDDYFYDLEDFFPYLRYAILFNQHLEKIHMVDEGLENLLKTSILSCQSVEELINALTSKRYTRSRISRMLIHILLHNTKQEIQKAMQIDYIRLLAFSKQGQSYVRYAKTQTDYAIISNITRHQALALDIEMRGAKVLSLVERDAYKKEYATIPYHE